jgi:exopolyphosphatase/guanosine-5'-triphosphate,3'-diphosphate pyrophosphatase
MLAAADIGSNTAHLLIAESDGTRVQRRENRNEWIALGQIVAERGEIPDAVEQLLVSAVRDFRRLADSHRVERLYVFATEAMRVAKNHEDVLNRIRRETGVEVDVITPRREAELSFLGTRLDSPIERGLLCEAGGGSLQIGVIEDHCLGESESLPLGTGRIVAISGLSNPPTGGQLHQAEAYIREFLEESALIARQRAQLDLRPRVGILSGGVGRGIWRALHPDGDPVIRMQELEYLAWATARLPEAMIVQRFRVKPKRAGTLLPGSLLYRALMHALQLDQLQVSEYGIREGAILEMAASAVRA